MLNPAAIVPTVQFADIRHDLTDTETSYVLDTSIWYRETVSKTYATDNSDTPTTVSTSREQLTGLSGGTRAVASSVDVHGNTTVTATTVDRENALVTRTVETPFSTTDQVSITRNGLLQSTTSASGNTTTYAYDALGRQTGMTDPRIGTSVTHYDANGRVDYVQDPAGNTTSYGYDNMGRRTSVTDPLGNTVYSGYTDHGLLEKTWGSGTYPVSYEYDSYGRMTKMHTYRGGSGWSGVIGRRLLERGFSPD